MQNWDNLNKRFLSDGTLKNVSFLKFSKQPETFVSSETYLKTVGVSQRMAVNFVVQLGVI